EVKIKIKRPGTEEPIIKTLIRQEIKINNVPYYGMINEEIGYIRISQFTMNAGDEVKKAFIELKENMHADKIILDLRGNPGGLLIEAVNICNIFMDKGQEIVSTKGKVSQWDKVYHGMHSPVDTEIPVIILVNRGSASASEIVSGAFQDLDRGVIIGERTFGKGLVQTTRNLSYNSKLKITTAKYYIPSGRCIQALDYSNRNDDGSVGKIPDSLITEYTTKNGRKVFDGGGVYPDVLTETELLSNISASLLSKFLIFDFVTGYALKHDSIPKPGLFVFTSDDYDDFLAFLSDKDFDYKTNSETELNDLINIAKKEKYYKTAENQFSELKKILAHDRDKDLQTFRNEIIQLLSEEISCRYYYQRGRIETLLKSDKDIEKAIEIFSDMNKYEGILKGTYKTGEQKETD
ncbi:MAG: S41 family peptidase, partial [Bacteroidota bacterium]